MEIDDIEIGKKKHPALFVIFAIIFPVLIIAGSSAYIYKVLIYDRQVDSAVSQEMTQDERKASESAEVDSVLAAETAKEVPKSAPSPKPVKRLKRSNKKSTPPPSVSYSRSSSDVSSTSESSSNFEKAVLEEGGPTGTVFIATGPPKADIYYKGNKVGQTNQTTLTLPVGTVELTFKKGYLSLTKEFDIQEGKNKSPYFRLD